MPGLTGLQFQTITIPFAAGLQTKSDPRALQPPGLSICSDAEFDDLGALRTRKTYVDIGENIIGGGTLSNIRKLFMAGTELCCFTSDSLYGWSDTLAGWVFKGTHLAVALDEDPVFTSNGDQVCCDRAELNGVEFVCWIDGSVDGGDLWLAARGSADGEVIRLPTKIDTNASWPRLVALNSKVLVLYITGTGGAIMGAALDPASPTATVTPTSLVSTISSFRYGAYDIEQVPGADKAFLAAVPTGTTLSYKVATITAGLAVATSQKSRTVGNPSAVAVACMPGGTTATVIRYTTTLGDVRADMITISSLADGTVDTSLITSGTHDFYTSIAAAYRSVQVSGHWQCEVFLGYTDGPTASSAGFLRHVTINDASSVGSDTNLIGLVFPSSRAFDHNGRVFLWTTFGQRSGFLGDDASKIPELDVQNACYLYRDDGFLCAKAVYDVAGEALENSGTGAYGCLPGVQSIDGSTYRHCAMEARALALGNNSAGYGARSPRVVAATFDSNDARRTARIGAATYIAGGECLYYDGRSLVEVGFHVAPHYWNASKGGAGNVPDGTYGSKATWRYQSAAGETERSTSAVRGTSSMSGGPAILQTGTNSGLVSATQRWFPLYITHKGTSVAVEVWRTEVNPTEDFPFYLVSSKDPKATTGANRYVTNDPTLFTLGEFDDSDTDATISVNEENPENDGSLENLAPPAAKLIVAHESRVFLAGVAGDSDRIWYSKQRTAGQIVAFHDALTIGVPPQGGSIMALAVHPQTQALVAFRQRSAWRLDGTGYDNTGGGSNYSSVMVAPDVGAVSAESVAAVPIGLIFKSQKGWYKLGPGFDLSYIGAPVAAFDSDTVLGIDVMESQHQVRIVSSARILIYDYLVDAWGSWTFANAVGSTVRSDGAHTIATASSVLVQTSSFGIGTVNYGMDVEIAFFKPAGLMGNMFVRSFQILGEFRSACALRIRLARDYQQDGSGNWVYYDDDVWTVTPTTVGSALQVRVGPSQKSCEAIKVRITAINADGNTSHTPTGEAIKLTGIAFDIGTEDGLYNQLPATQKT